MAGEAGSGEPGGQDGSRAPGAARIARAAAAGRNRLLADANLIGALVRIDEIEVAARAIQEQRRDLVDYAIDLREAVAREAGPMSMPADPPEPA